MNLLDIFKAGTWTTMDGQELTFTEADLAASAAAYDPAVFRAPLVVGHPKTNDPAYGWVAAVAKVGDTLKALPEQVEAQFAALVNAGRFGKISASFFAPTAKNNPKPGVWYPRHVGFLGAAAPAVVGLKTPAFAADDDGVVSIEFAAPAATPTPKQPEAPMPDPKKTEEQQAADFAAAEQELKDREAALAAKEKALADNEAKARSADIAAFADGLEKEGRLLPRDKAGLVAFMAQLDDAGAVSFAAADGEVKKPAGEWLRGFLSQLPVQVDFAERAAPVGDEAAGAGANFAAPPGYGVDASRMALHQKIQQYADKHKVDYATAAAAVGG